ncbi:uncharacterized protein N7496_010283 [Penicillium cataractarum]|uniref:MARVEL domain-containing protein n=1 Tax=Penicillium cataractarum TaxID=2100454 RepID=A0A9W9V2Y3_9EURO|nr:uncharacterized protein N7496_010283 [Penicillium cataractarum]KAJ5364570.1 hypothetical protein N7496_010283 [Penicillium cataractarum]
MTEANEIIRPFLFAVRVALLISAVIVMGITAWAVTHLKNYRTIFTLVVAVLSTVLYIPSVFTSCMQRNRGYMIPLDIVFYALWLAAFIFVAQTNGTLSFDNAGCRYYVWDLNSGCAKRNAIEAFTFLSLHSNRYHSFWTLCGLCLEILNVYLQGRSVDTPSVPHPEKPIHDGPESSTPGDTERNRTVPTTGHVPAMNEEQNGV